METPQQAPPTHMMPPMPHPYYMGDPRYMPHPLPYMPHPPPNLPHLPPNIPHPLPYMMPPPPGKADMPHPLHHQMTTPINGGHGPHPQMYPAMYPVPPPVMFQSVKEEGSIGDGSGHKLTTPTKRVTVKRSQTMDSGKDRSKQGGRRSRKPGGAGSQVDEGEGPKGFDEFAL